MCLLSSLQRPVNWLRELESMHTGMFTLTGDSYSQSRATALVVDIGARNTGVTAIYEGMVLRKSKQGSSSSQRHCTDTIQLYTGHH